jgi:DNA-binding transcriptional LysR family regulator
MLESRDLELLVAIVESGTLRGASAVAHLSQPAISRRVRALESKLGVRLFQPVGRRLALTDAGREFIEQSSGILDRIRNLEEEMDAFRRGQRGVLRIGATVTVCLYLIAPILEAMRRQHPEYELFVTNESSRRMPDLVRSGAVDVGIASAGGPLPGLHLVGWRELHLGLLRAGAGDANSISIRSMQDQPLVISSSGSLRTAIETSLAGHGVTPRISAEADSLEVVRMLVACGFGSAIVPLEVMVAGDLARSTAPGAAPLTLTPFREPLAPLPVACFYQRVQPPLRAFLDLLLAPGR